MGTPKRLSSASRAISVGTWNQYADAVSRFNSPSNGPASQPEYSENLVFAKTDGDFIPPHTVCRIVERYSLDTKDVTKVGYVVESVTGINSTPVGRHSNYAISGSEGVDVDSGSVYVSGMALIKVPKDDAVTGDNLLGYDANDPENQYEGKGEAAYYVAPDASLFQYGDIRVAPVGHFRITSWYVADDFEDADYLYLCVNMDDSSTTVRVLTEADIDAVEELEEEVDPTPEEPDSGDETMEPTGEVVISSTEAAVFYYMEPTSPVNDKQSLQKSDNWKVKVYNLSEESVAAGVHTATYSKEYNCFVIIKPSPSSGVFPIAMTWEDPEAEGNEEGDGGLQGTFNSPASWTYSITKFEDTVLLGEDVDIIAPPHHYRRPNGQMNKATYGLATYDSSGALVVISCNETIISATC